MLTQTAEAPQQKAQPAHRPFEVTVKHVARLSPHFVRITFTGSDLVLFGDTGLDQRIKIVLPLEGAGYAHFPQSDDWWSDWRALPAAQQNPFRTYTAKAVRQADREVDVDFVAHGDAGPASAWVARAAVGDRIVIVGPNALGGYTHSGVEWSPRGAKTVLLAGDETAVPAITSIVESLDQDARGCVFLEVPTIADVLSIAHPAGVHVEWLPRDAAGYGDRLVAAVRDWTSRYLTASHHGRPTDIESLAEVDIDHEILWEVPQGTDLGGDLYAFLAGEAGAIKALRRFLVSEVGLHRSQVAFMGYWRLGKSEN